MSFTITDAFVQQFSGAIRMTSQQKKARVRPVVLEDSITGDSAYMEQVAPTAAKKQTSRHGDSPVVGTQHLRRRVAPYTYDWGDLIDKDDRVRMLIDPESTYVLSASQALERGIDDELIAAAFGTAYVGHSGSIALQWPNGNSESNPAQPAGTQVAVNSWTYGTGSGNTGLTISKLIEAQMALDAAEADEDEDRFIICSAKQIGNLLATTEATSSDYAEVRALQTGKIKEFMGFKFIRSQRIAVDGNGYQRVIAGCRSGLGLGIAQDIWTRVAERPDKRFATYAYAAMDLGGARLEEAKMVEVKCA